MSDPEDVSQWQAEDVISRGYKHDPAFAARTENTRPVDAIDVSAFDALLVAGGQGPMFIFENAANLHAKFSEFYEAGRSRQRILAGGSGSGPLSATLAGWSACTCCAGTTSGGSS